MYRRGEPSGSRNLFRLSGPRWRRVRRCTL